MTSDLDHLDKIEAAFQKTTQILFGQSLHSLRDYKTYLLRYVGGPVKRKSEVSDLSVYIPNIQFYTSIKKNFVTLEEALEIGKRALTKDAATSLTLVNASETLKPIKLFSSDAIEGENSNVQESTVYMNAHHCLGGVFYVYSKYCAYCFWPRESEYVFGCYYLFASKFCIQCHNSVSLNRCFEVSDSNKCSDCYFCHNCENLTDCMFCFKVKSMRYAIGNVELPREKYLMIKNNLLKDLASRLEKNKSLDLSIYSLSGPSSATVPERHQ